MTHDELMEDLARCKANQSLLMPQHKNLSFERFCKDPVAFYLYKRKNLFLEDKLAKKEEEKLNTKRRKLLHQMAQRQERARKDAEKQAMGRTGQLNPIVRANRTGNQTSRAPHHATAKSHDLNTTFSNPALKAYETAPQQTRLPGIKGAQKSPPATPKRMFMRVKGEEASDSIKSKQLLQGLRVSTAASSLRKPT